ncbi:MAG: bifunctional helix-turn-helix domain-containing protein/methylated-DNA--[protein]-cysteine S-methyltransferase [Desulfobacteraceae bacterium]|nr:bifunctional helix-turn-helix domain-containing protein/methylated-DNA--[protein]-cysteine S-methyltransferase [Desulfobacteraceae bacterium]
MKTMDQLALDYHRVEKAIDFLENNVRRQPSLDEIAAAVDLSAFHFQRLFSRWVGISPKRFLQFLTKEYAKSLLDDTASLLDASWDAGLSGSGRLHDLFVHCEALTPGQYKRRGEGITISWGVHPSPFGKFLLAVTDRGICALRFVADEKRGDPNAWLQCRWPKANLVRDPLQTADPAGRIFPFGADHEPAPLHLFVQGTNFQIKVWEALCAIPLGKAVTYEDVARHIGLPTAARAVGNAVGKNPIPFIIPCHRVIRKMGEFGNYGEGPTRKKVMLGWEAARIHGAVALSAQIERKGLPR